MDLVAETFDLKNLDKSGWQTFRFDQLAQRISEPVDPSTTDLDIYVGLEHLDSESIHIRRFGSPSDVKGGKLKCYPGDIIFGKRRAYQRKAAIANFEGICSAHAFVLRAIPEVLDPQLFPFFLHSDVFMHRAVDISVGGLSPTINWKHLREQEFLLPPKDQQAKITELLWAMDEVVEKEFELMNNVQRTYQTLIDNCFSTRLKESWTFQELSQIATINRQSLKNTCNPDYTFKYLDIAGIIEPKIMGPLESMKFKNAPSRARRITADNSIILSMVRPYHKSFVFLENPKDIIASTGTSVIEVNGNHIPRFVFHQFFSSRFMRFCEDRMTGTNYPAITPKDLAQFGLMLPPGIDTELALANQFEDFDISTKNTRSKIKQSKVLLKSLIEQLFSIHQQTEIK